MKAKHLMRVLSAAAALLLTATVAFAVGETDAPATTAESVQTQQTETETPQTEATEPETEPAEETTEFDLEIDLTEVAAGTTKAAEEEKTTRASTTREQTTRASETTTERATTERTTRRVTEVPAEKPVREEEPAREEEPEEEEPEEEREEEEPEEKTTKARKTEKTTAPDDEEETTTLPDGAFYVYLECNNSTDHRLRYLMRAPGIVSEPEDPLRKGYIFDGWFSDPACTKPWNFATDIATKSITIYAKWKPDKTTIVYRVRVQQTEGGRIEVNPNKATEGEIININAFPDEGMRVKPGSVLVNGEPIDILNFVMPDVDVLVSVTFEKIPARTEEESSNLRWVFVLVAALALLVLTGAIVLLQRRRLQLEAEEDDTPSDVDESAVVSNGFDANGNIVQESKEPYQEDGNDYLDD